MSVHPPNRHQRLDLDARQGRPIAIALAITMTFLVVEIVGGLLTNSLALLADAGHMLTDVAALALALSAVWLSQKPPTPELSFGYHRAEVLAALFNSAMLITLSLFIFWEAYERVGTPREVDSRTMLWIAIAGLLANGASAWVLSHKGGHKEDLNRRGAFLHVVGDTLGSIGAIVAALIMLTTGWYLADPILSVLIGLLILRTAWQLLADSVNVLMEATPPHIDSLALRETLRSIEGVADAHDIHVRTVTSSLLAMSGHIDLAGEREWQLILNDACSLLRERFGIVHVTLQPEARGRLSGPLREHPVEERDDRETESRPNSERAGP